MTAVNSFHFASNYSRPVSERASINSSSNQQQQQAGSDDDDDDDDDDATLSSLLTDAKAKLEIQILFAQTLMCLLAEAYQERV